MWTGCKHKMLALQHNLEIEKETLQFGNKFDFLEGG